MFFKNIIFVLLITSAFWQTAFAGNWCHITGEDQVTTHPQFKLGVDYQVNFNGSTFLAAPIWINLYDQQVGGRVFARLINHYYYGQNPASAFIELQYSADENKFTGQIPGAVDLGGTDPNMILKVWQTLEIRYGSVSGPSEEKNLNLSKGYLNQRCLMSF